MSVRKVLLYLVPLCFVLLSIPFCNADVLWQLLMFSGDEVKGVSPEFSLVLRTAAKNLSTTFAPNDARRVICALSVAADTERKQVEAAELELLRLIPQVFGKHNFLTIEVLQELEADYAHESSSFHRVFAYGMSAVDLTSKTYGTQHPAVAVAASALGSKCGHYYERGRIAEKLIRQAIEISESRSWDYGGTRFRYISSLAKELERQGRKEEAARIYASLIAARKAAGKAEEEELMETLSNAAALDAELGRDDDAFRKFMDCVRAHCEADGSSNRVLKKSQSLNDCANLAMNNDRWELACKLFKLAHEASVEESDKLHASATHLRWLQCEARLRPRRTLVRMTETAQQAIDQAVLADGMADVGSIYACLGELKRATDAYQRAIAEAKKEQTGNTWKISRYYHCLAVLFARERLLKLCEDARKKETELPESILRQFESSASEKDNKRSPGAKEADPAGMEQKLGLARRLDQLDAEIEEASSNAQLNRELNEVTKALADADRTLVLLKRYSKLTTDEEDYVAGKENGMLLEKASLEFMSGNLLAAKRTYAEARKRKFSPADRETFLDVLIGSAVTARESGDLEDAATLFAEADEQLAKLYPSSDARLRQTLLLEKSVLNIERGLLEQAAKTIGLAKRELHLQLIENSELDDYFWLSLQQGRLEFARGDRSGAIASLRFALGLTALLNRQDDYDAQYARLLLAECLHAEHKDVEAETLLRKVITSLASLGKDHYVGGKAQLLLSAIMKKKGEESDSLRQAALKTLKTQLTESGLRSAVARYGG